MVQTKDNEGTSQSSGMFYRSPVVTSRSDLFPKLVAMQKLVGARNFVVTKAAASGFPNKKKLTCELENWGMNAAEQSAQFIRAVGDILLDHIETSLLPVIWRNKNAGGFADLPDVPALMRRIENDTLPYAGLALPVRLGTIGNGYIVFCGSNLVLDNEVVIEQHIKCC